MGVDASFARRDYSGKDIEFYQAFIAPPYGVNIRDDIGIRDKFMGSNAWMRNPLWNITPDTYDNMDIRNNFRLNTYANIKVPWVKGLSYRVSLVNNLDLKWVKEFRHEKGAVSFGYGPERFDDLSIYLNTAYGFHTNEKTYSYVFDNIISYKNKFGNHSIEGTLVATTDHWRYEYQYSHARDFAANGNTNLGYWGIDKGSYYTIESNVIEKANIGYLGRLRYSFHDRYYLTTSYRRDGASVFGADNKWGNFFATAMVWRISEENFMKPFNPLSSLKLKLSWGQNGNQGIAPYSTLTTVANGLGGG